MCGIRYGAGVDAMLYFWIRWKGPRKNQLSSENKDLFYQSVFLIRTFLRTADGTLGRHRFWAIEERKPVKWGKGGVKTCCLNTRSWDGSDKMPTHFQLSGVWSDLLLATFVNWGQEEPWLLEERESSRYI